MTNQTIEELRRLKDDLEKSAQLYGLSPLDDIYTLDKAIIACEQLRRARKKAKRWKRKYLTMEANYDDFKKLDADEIIAKLEELKGGYWNTWIDERSKDAVIEVCQNVVESWCGRAIDHVKTVEKGGAECQH